MICHSLEAPDKNTFWDAYPIHQKPILDRSYGIGSLEENGQQKESSPLANRRIHSRVWPLHHSLLVLQMEQSF
jgi:hypothetical protein